tara:strand:- start:1760 stop:2644 length:885 start_codon:yes stop_codon:yes gene_type:complete
MKFKNLINISELNREDIINILKYADQLNKKNENFLSGKNIGLIFEKNSTRTRLSFQVGINQLEGNYIDIKLNELNLDRFESYEDTFEIMACYLDSLVFRTNDHQKLELAKKFFKKPIINALSEKSHPCQAISDIYTIKEHFKRLDNINISWLGDMNNVLYSLIEIINLLGGFKIHIFTDEKIYSNLKNQFNLTDDVVVHFELDHDVLSSSNCIMTDVHNSMNDKMDKELELKKFQVNEELMAKTKEDAVFMHCLPAKIGSEVTSNVIKGNKSIVLSQAKNRMIAQKGILKWLDI